MRHLQPIGLIHGRMDQLVLHGGKILVVGVVIRARWRTGIAACSGSATQFDIRHQLGIRSVEVVEISKEA